MPVSRSYTRRKWNIWNCSLIVLIGDVSKLKDHWSVSIIEVTFFLELFVILIGLLCSTVAINVFVRVCWLIQWLKKGLYYLEFGYSLKFFEDCYCFYCKFLHTCNKPNFAHDIWNWIFRSGRLHKNNFKKLRYFQLKKTQACSLLLQFYSFIKLAVV